MDTWMRWLAPAGAVVSVMAPVPATEYLSVPQAQRVIFPTATRFDPLALHPSPAQLKAIAHQLGQTLSGNIPSFWLARGPNGPVGILVVDQVWGKHRQIDYAVGLDRHAAVTQIEIMVFRETHGGAIRDAHWRHQFVGKGPASTLQVGHDIVNISGSTLSCHHVTDGVRRILAIATACLGK